MVLKLFTTFLLLPPSWLHPNIGILPGVIVPVFIEFTGLTSNTLFAIKAKSLTAKCFTYTIYSKDGKCRTMIFCLTTETWRLMVIDFSSHMACRLTCAG